MLLLILAALAFASQTSSALYTNKYIQVLKSKKYIFIKTIKSMYLVSIKDFGS